MRCGWASSTPRPGSTWSTSRTTPTTSSTPWTSSVTSTDPAPEATDVLLRPAEAGDAGAIVEVHLEARAAAPMPPSVHDADDIRRWVTARTTDAEVWIAEQGGAVVA